MHSDPFKEYIKQSEPGKREKGYAWHTAIGLQAVDGLKTSEYLIDTAIKNKEYGPEYANKIHVHHIIPVSEIGEEYVIDPITDLIPVCPNCHMVLHTGEGISVEELKKKVKKTKDKMKGSI
ncbi:MAG: HNH endonuclease [Bacillota bacterium]|nr:HNH endonuclease [Bacillota bacterium]